MNSQSRSSIDPEEIARFDALAQHWWDPKGEFRPLHAMNPLRIGYIRDQIAGQGLAGQGLAGQAVAETRPLDGLRIADIGCGGGLLAEPLARLGAAVTGVDASQSAIAVATRHADRQGLSIDYLCSSAESVSAASPGKFDVVTALEIVEHVGDVQRFIAAIADLLRPGGLAFFSTLNRTPKSYATAIVGAEYLLHLLPKGTHNWRRFLRPGELDSAVRGAGLITRDIKGMVFSPLRRTWRLSQHRLAINYALMAVKPD